MTGFFKTLADFSFLSPQLSIDIRWNKRVILHERQYSGSKGFLNRPQSYWVLSNGFAPNGEGRSVSEKAGFVRLPRSWAKYIRLNGLFRVERERERERERRKKREGGEGVRLFRTEHLYNTRDSAGLPSPIL